MKALVILSVLVFTSVMLVQVPDASAHKTAIVGFFQGTNVDNSITALGNFQINNERSKLNLVGEMQELLTDNRVGGCKNIRASFILTGDDTDIDLEFTGKKCTYGNSVFAMGYIESVNSSDANDVVVKGRLTFMIDQRTGLVTGHIIGSLIF